MKFLGSILAIFALLLGSNAFANEPVAPLKLELSKTLTLNPDGQPPAKTISEPPEKTGLLPFVLLGAGLIGIGLAYRQGRVSVETAQTHQQQQLLRADEKIASLKDAMIESGSGARDEWQSTLSTYKNQVDEKSRNIDALHDQTAKQREQLAQMEQQLAQHSIDAESSSEEKLQALEHLDQQHTIALQSQAAEHRAALEQAQNQTSTSELQLASIEENSNATRQELATTQQKHEQLQQHNAQLSDQLLELKAELKTGADQSTAAQKDKMELEQKITQLNEQLQTQSEQQQTYEADTRNLQSELETLRASNDQLHTTQQEQLALESQLKERDADIQALYSELENAQQHSDDLEAVHQQKSTLEAQLAESEQSLKQQHIALNDATIEQSRLKEAVQKNQTLEALNLDSHQKIETLSSELDASQAEQSRLGEMSTAVASLEAENAELTHTIDRLTSELKSLHDMQTRLDAVEQENLSFKSRITEASSQFQALNLSQQNNDEKLVQSISKQEQLEDENTALKLQSQELSAQTKELEQQKEAIEAELLETQAQTNFQETLVSDRDAHVQTLLEENTQQLEQLAELHQVKHNFTDTITDLEFKLSQSDSTQLQAQSDVMNSAEQLKTQLQERSQKLETLAANNDALSKQVQNLAQKLSQFEEDIRLKDLKLLKTGTELVEYKFRQEQYLQDIALLEHQREEAPKTNANEAAHDDTIVLAETLRARDNIVLALEEELEAAEAGMEELQQQVENLELAAVARKHHHEPEPSANKTSKNGEALKQQLVEKIRRITILEADLKVHKDLVKVFEDDSNQLQKIEPQMEELTETNSFLQSELASAVNENARLKETLKQQIAQAEKHKDIGRSNAAPAARQELLFRLAALEAQNKEHLELIAALKSKSQPTNDPS